jgi:hypothetical protein
MIRHMKVAHISDVVEGKMKSLCIICLTDIIL